MVRSLLLLGIENWESQSLFLQLPASSFVLLADRVFWSREVHAVKGPTLGVAERNAPIEYRAEVIIVREKRLPLSDIASEEDESVKDEA